MMNRAPLTAVLIAALALAGCASPLHRAPVEDRGASRGAAPAPAGAATPAAPTGAAVAPSDPSKALPGAENAGKPGYYTVKPGDTVLRVALETGQNWRDIVRWNNMDNPNVIEVGQVLRVAPPASELTAAAKPVATPKIDTKPLDAAKPQPAASAPATTAAATPPTSAPSVVTADDDVSWAWPAARSSVAAGFDETRSKGLVFLGKAGDPVMAAADGKVVYAGNGLRGFGNLVIVKHNNTYLSVYAHNQTLAVKEDQAVKRGQKIAEMGATDAERVQLHFEVRRQGKPVDPAKLLPSR